MSAGARGAGADLSREKGSSIESTSVPWLLKLCTVRSGERSGGFWSPLELLQSSRGPKPFTLMSCENVTVWLSPTWRPMLNGPTLW